VSSARMVSMSDKGSGSPMMLSMYWSWKFLTTRASASAVLMSPSSDAVKISFLSPSTFLNPPKSMHSRVA